MSTTTVTLAGKTIEVDEEGFLVDRSDWNEEVAEAIAKADGIELTPEHWEVISLVRGYYDEHQCGPSVSAWRVLIKTIAEKRAAAKMLSPPNKGLRKYLYKLSSYWYEQEVLRETSAKYSKKYLYELFGTTKQAYRYAGLPLPRGT